jgi:methionyl-tRNA formyltransferase
MKILFAGTPDIAEKVLNGLISYATENQHEIVGALTQPDRPAGRGQKIIKSAVKLLAEAHHIPIFQPLSFNPKKDPTSPEIFEQLQALKPDLMIVTAYGLILPKFLLDLPQYGCWNIHVSLLPKWRGAAPIQRAIEAGDRETGICLMQMDQGLDTGDILARKTCPILLTDTAQILHDRLAQLGLETLTETLSELEKISLKNTQESLSLSLPREIQDHTQATYAHKIDKAEGKINWQEPALEIHHKIMAFNPWPVCFSTLETSAAPITPQIIRLWKSSPTETSSSFPPGTLIRFEKNKLGVVAGDQKILELLEIQLPGKKAMSMPEILNGYGELLNGARFS